jgi:hypothetical protein
MMRASSSINSYSVGRPSCCSSCSGAARSSAEN